ncbi:hypothetical protein NADE_001645 [Nannochloris sp. 'desiccata']|nr:hypothetical protein NADE_001645 [Chlorella desiccata (nom. nud.)]
MAAMHEEEVIETSECGKERFAGIFEFHKTDVTQLGFVALNAKRHTGHSTNQNVVANEFADIIEESEPKFARWMRSHGKLAVLKDDEVDRLERASSAASGPSRQDVIGFNASYSAEERLAMHRKIEEEKTTARRAALLPPSYLAIDIPRDMGMDYTFWKSVLKSAPETEVLALEHPPTSYYWAPCEDAGSSEKEVRRLQPSKGQKRGDGAVTPAALAEA